MSAMCISLEELWQVENSKKNEYFGTALHFHNKMLNSEAMNNKDMILKNLLKLPSFNWQFFHTSGFQNTVYCHCAKLYLQVIWS